jgi:SseB protein N-terminal domain
MAIVSGVRFSRPSGDTGQADPAVAAALDAYARGVGSEHDALTAIAASRLLVPVVAMLADDPALTENHMLTKESSEAGGLRGVAHRTSREAGTEKDSEMALPTLIGNDGRTAVIAFTGTEPLGRWRQDARPVPVAAARVCEAALAEADALVIDVAGPVPLAVEGARLRALADDQPPPPPHEDPDVSAAIAAVTPRFTLEPGGQDTDLTVVLHTADAEEARRIAGQIAVRLASRLRRGIEVRAAR